MIEHPLPKCPVEVGVNAHWLAVDGVQPAIPENAAVGPPPSKKRKVAEGGTLITAGGEHKFNAVSRPEHALVLAAWPV